MATTNDSPPCVPKELPHTAKFCEENVYLLVNSYLSSKIISKAWRVYAVFISNCNKCVALWQQKSEDEPQSEDGLVIWDYHCILVLVRKADGSGEALSGQIWVYDSNSRLGSPCIWSDYIQQTFRNSWAQESWLYRSWFRVVHAEKFLAWFASDRSHMCTMSTEGVSTYLSPPPAYPPIIGRLAMSEGLTNNLMERWVSMEDADPNGAYGKVWEGAAFVNLEWVSHGVTGY